MAEKNWLIRTKNKQILGPATKQKIIELIEKGSLTGEDEVSSGNGYWFWIKETDLLDKYIYGDESQTFNPISEAESVLAVSGVRLPTSSATPAARPSSPPPSKPAPTPKSNESVFPDDEDLEYPDMDLDLSHEDKTGEIDLGEMEDEVQSEDQEEQSAEDDVTRLDLSDLSGQIAAMKAETSDLSANDHEESDQKEELPEDTDLEYPDLDSNDGDESSAPPEVSAVPPKKKPLFRKKVSQKPEFKDDSGEGEGEKASAMPSPVKMTKQRNDKYLFFILILAFFLIAIVFYYYRMVLNKPIPLVGISEAHAQTIKPLPITISKKKTFLKLKI